MTLTRRIGISMRVVCSEYGETRDALARDWPVLLEQLGRAHACAPEWFLLPNIGEDCVSLARRYGIQGLLAQRIQLFLRHAWLPLRCSFLRLRRRGSAGLNGIVVILFLGLATLYALLIPLKGSLTLFDGVVFLGIYVAYMCIIARRPCEEEEPEGPAATLAKLSRPARMRAVAGLFLFAALVILFNAEPFSESLVASGKILGINEFLLVQWLAPIASEAPEFIVALMFAFRGNAGLALGSLLSSKLNQWTLLVGMIPGVYAVSSGGTTPINLDPHQFQEIFLTAGQSIFAVALLLDLRLGLREAAALLVFFLAQLFSPFYDVQLEALLGLPHDPLRLHNFYAWTYLILAGLLLLRHWRLVAELRYGFHVKVRDIVHH